jgi:predicted transcriptional regulator
MQREKNVRTTHSGSVTMTQADDPLLPLVARIVSAYVEHNETRSDALSGLIRGVYQVLANAGSGTVARPRQTEAAPVAARKGPGGQTVFADHLVCMECGLHMKMLKRHLKTVHKESPAQYRTKWNLPGDYPMVARQYAALRSSLAKESGLGKRLPR